MSLTNSGDEPTAFFADHKDNAQKSMIRACVCETFKINN